jgi:hypothetical protein
MYWSGNWVGWIGFRYDVKRHKGVEISYKLTMLSYNVNQVLNTNHQNRKVIE